MVGERTFLVFLVRIVEPRLLALGLLDDLIQHGLGRGLVGRQGDAAGDPLGVAELAVPFPAPLPEPAGPGGVLRYAMPLLVHIAGDPELEQPGHTRTRSRSWRARSKALRATR